MAAAVLRAALTGRRIGNYIAAEPLNHPLPSPPRSAARYETLHVIPTDPPTAGWATQVVPGSVSTVVASACVTIHGSAADRCVRTESAWRAVYCQVIIGWSYARWTVTSTARCSEATALQRTHLIRYLPPKTGTVLE
jgi:hypothetical protein